MLVSGGYPNSYEKNKEIKGLEKLEANSIFYAGAKQENDKIMTNGGRVLAINSLAANLQEALDQSYAKVDKISFDKMYFRKDLGKDLINF